MLSNNTAQAELLVIVNPRAQVSSISKADLASLYLGKKPSDNAAENLTPIDQSPNEVRESFYQKLLGKSTAEMKAYWSREIFTGHAYPPKEEDGDAAVKAAIAENPSYVGYISSNTLDNSVKVVAHVEVIASLKKQGAMA